jgi:hypothetical protein
MKKFLHSRNGACRGAALIIVLALLMPATIYNTEQAMAASDSSCVLIATAQIVTAGNLYKVGDILDPLFGNLCNPDDNYGFRLQVTSVASPGPGCVNGGCVTGVTIIPGIGYSAPPSNPIRFGGSPTGTGFTANCTFN